MRNTIPLTFLLAILAWTTCWATSFPITEFIEFEPEQIETPTAPAAPRAAAPPTPQEIEQLVQQFDDRNPTTREAAIRRLWTHPQAAAEATIQALQKGNLNVQLTAFELLKEWNAPIDELDPWKPETLTPERLAALEAWQKEIADTGIEAPSRELTAEQKAQAEDEITRMLRVPEDETAVIRERLARWQSALLPLVYERLRTATTDRERQRLQALRYRLVAGETLAKNPALLNLASPETSLRRRSADELVNLATAEDQMLLRELFSDPDPLVREISLRGLRRTGGETQTMLLDLLADPEPNVRAAVLKQLEENPGRNVSPKIIEYVQTEKDADLVGHAVRVLRALRKQGDAPATRSLIELLKHDSWQVRADAAVALGERPGGWSSFYGEPREPSEAEKLQADVYTALIELLGDTDSFVVSKAIEGLQSVDANVAVEPFIEVIERSPNLAGYVIELLSRRSAMRIKAMPYLKNLAAHESPEIRIAIFDNLSAFGSNELGEKELTAGITDSDSRVRIAAAKALLRNFDTLRESTLRTNVHYVERDFPVYVEPPPTIFSAIGRLFGSAARQAVPVPVQPPQIVPPPPFAPVAPAGEEKKLVPVISFEGDIEVDDETLNALVTSIGVPENYTPGETLEIPFGEGKILVKHEVVPVPVVVPIPDSFAHLSAAERAALWHKLVEEGTAEARSADGETFTLVLPKLDTPEQAAIVTSALQAQILGAPPVIPPLVVQNESRERNGVERPDQPADPSGHSTALNPQPPAAGTIFMPAVFFEGDIEVVDETVAVLIESTRTAMQEEGKTMEIPLGEGKVIVVDKLLPIARIESLTELSDEKKETAWQKLIEEGTAQVELEGGTKLTLAAPIGSPLVFIPNAAEQAERRAQAERVMSAIAEQINESIETTHTSATIIAPPIVAPPVVANVENDGVSALQSYLALRSGTATVEVQDKWLADFHEGKGRPAWADNLIEPLEEMLASESLEEQIAAAAVLVPLGRADEMIPLLMELTQEKPEFADAVAGALPWIASDQRLQIFHEWRETHKPEMQQISRFLTSFQGMFDPRIEEILWKMLDEEDVSGDMVLYGIHELLQPYYFVDEFVYNRRSAPPARVRTELVEKLTTRAATGSEYQRLLAMAMLVSVDTAKAREIAAMLDADESLREELRRDAFQVRLLTQPNAKSRGELAVETLKRRDSMRSKLAIRALVSEEDYSFQILRRNIYLNVPESGFVPSGQRSSQAVPPGIELESLRPLLEDENEEIAAYAGYFAVLLGDAGGMVPLLKYWEKVKDMPSVMWDDGSAKVLVYRAVAVLDDPQYMPVLREIYGSLDEYRVRDFYWSIRGMTGAEILELRREMREKYGMENLQ